MIFSSFSHPCDVTDLIINSLSRVLIVVGVNMLVVVEIVAVGTTPVVTLECVVTTLYAVEVLGGVVTAICADVLADDLNFILSPLLEESLMFC